jgi:hypothetical protein
MRNTSTAYLLLAMQFFGAAGLHRFYLGKPITGLLWMATFGLGGLGTLYDLLTMEEQVEQANQRMFPAMRQQPMLAAAVPMGHNPYLPRQAQRSAAPAPARQELPLQTRLLQAAKNHRGRVTVMQAAAELGIRTQTAEEKLDELCHQGHANIEVSEDGVIFYDFPELRF